MDGVWCCGIRIRNASRFINFHGLIFVLGRSLECLTFLNLTFYKLPKVDLGDSFSVRLI